MRKLICIFAIPFLIGCDSQLKVDINSNRKCVKRHDILVQPIRWNDPSAYIAFVCDEWVVTNDKK